MQATTTTVKAIDRLRQSTANAWAPRPRAAPVDWITARVRLSEAYEARRGPYDTSERPWMRGILEAVANPNVRRIRLKASPQVGKTLLLQALLLYLADNAPASAMVILPDRDSAVEFRDRVYALAKESGFSVPPRWKWNTRHFDLGDMRCYLAWPKSKQRLRGRRCKYVFRSEIDVYEAPKRVGDPITSSDQRVKAFRSHLILDESSPIPEPSRIDSLERDSDRRRWWCCCPHCKRWQIPRFFTHQEGEHAGRGGVIGWKDDQGNYREPEVAKALAVYVCEHGGCQITNDQKPAFVAGGRWLPTGQRIDKRGHVVGKPERDATRIGFHLWALHSHNTWGEMAGDYVRAVRNGTVPDFWQNTLGLAHRSRTKMPTWQELGERAASLYSRGEVPHEAWFLTAGCDVQDREIYCVVRAWGDQRTSWLVDWFVFARTDGDDGEPIKSDFAQIRGAVLDVQWPIANGQSNPRGRKFLQVALLNIDANHRTMDAHEWAHSMQSKRVRTVRGDLSTKDKYRMTVVTHSKRDPTKIYRGGMELWGINVDEFKIDLAQRFLADPTRPGAWFVTKDCLEAGQFYLQQVVNEQKVMIRGKDGRPRPEWRERDSTIGHDFWDCEIYASAGGQMIVDGFPGNPGWDATRWPRPRAFSTNAGSAPAATREFE